jgi:hypothetical protein
LLTLLFPLFVTIRLLLLFFPYSVGLVHCAAGSPYLLVSSFQERTPGAFVYAAFTHGFISHSPTLRPPPGGAAAAATPAAATPAATTPATTAALGRSPSNAVALKASSEWT